jgi:hypothetical protein
VLGTNKKVTVLEVGDEDFKDYHKHLNDFYKPFPAYFQSSHVFHCKRDMLNDNYKLVVQLRKSNLEDAELIEFEPIKERFFGRGRHPAGRDGLQQAIAARPSIMNIEKDPDDPDKECYDITILYPQGVPDYKQLELCKNYRQFVPEKHKDVTCPKPAESVLATMKIDKAKRRKGKKIKKEEQEKTLNNDSSETKE